MFVQETPPTTCPGEHPLPWREELSFPGCRDSGAHPEFGACPAQSPKPPRGLEPNYVISEYSRATGLASSYWLQLPSWAPGRFES